MATPLGPITVAAENNALSGLWFIGQKYYPTDADGWTDQPDNPVFTELRGWLAAYFAGDHRLPALRIAPQGTPFQCAVWERVRDIPYGHTTTYGEIAQQITVAGKLSATSARAVGNAVGHNPLLLVIPCHRVVGSDHSLTGYAGGIHRKQALLQLEREHRSS